MKVVRINSDGISAELFYTKVGASEDAGVNRFVFDRAIRRDGFYLGGGGVYVYPVEHK